MLGSYSKYFRIMSTTRLHTLGNFPVRNPNFKPPRGSPGEITPPGTPRATKPDDPPQKLVGLRRENQSRRRLRRFVFTLNNYTEEELESIRQFGTDKCRWMIVAKETGETGTSHLQGGALLISQTCFSTLKRSPGFERAHLENMYGKPEDTLLYCSKQDPDPYIIGELPVQGILSKTPVPNVQVNVMICTML